MNTDSANFSCGVGIPITSLHMDVSSWNMFHDPFSNNYGN